MSQIIVTIIVAALLVPGLLGVILPIMPGIPYMFLIALIFALITKFSILTGIELGYLAIIVGISILVDYFSGILGAKFGGASGKSLLIGMAGFLLGILLFPPLGGLVGMFIGIVASEIYFFGKTRTAVKAASGGVLGTIAGIALNLIAGLIFIILFLVFTL
jgi:uncharacterized protein YqgC (DUF456 family)